MPKRKWILGTVPATGKARWYATILRADPNVEFAISRGRQARQPRDNDPIASIRRMLSELYVSDNGHKIVFEMNATDRLPAISGLQEFDNPADLRAALNADPEFHNTRSSDD